MREKQVHVDNSHRLEGRDGLYSRLTCRDSGLTKDGTMTQCKLWNTGSEW